jgi:hypothetical protein
MRSLLPSGAIWSTAQTTVRTSGGRTTPVSALIKREAREWQVAVHPDDLQELIDTSLRMVAAGQVGQFEARLGRHDGSSAGFF